MYRIKDQTEVSRLNGTAYSLEHVNTNHCDLGRYKYQTLAAIAKRAGINPIPRTNKQLCEQIRLKKGNAPLIQIVHDNHIDTSLRNDLDQARTQLGASLTRQDEFARQLIALRDSLASSKSGLAKDTLQTLKTEIEQNKQIIETNRTEVQQLRSALNELSDHQNEYEVKLQKVGNVDSAEFKQLQQQYHTETEKSARLETQIGELTKQVAELKTQHLTLVGDSQKAMDQLRNSQLELDQKQITTLQTQVVKETEARLKMNTRLDQLQSTIEEFQRHQPKIASLPEMDDQELYMQLTDDEKKRFLEEFVQYQHKPEADRDELTMNMLACTQNFLKNQYDAQQMNYLTEHMDWKQAIILDIVSERSNSAEAHQAFKYSVDLILSQSLLHKEDERLAPQMNLGVNVQQNQFIQHDKTLQELKTSIMHRGEKLKHIITPNTEFRLYQNQGHAVAFSDLDKEDLERLNEFDDSAFLKLYVLSRAPQAWKKGRGS